MSIKLIDHKLMVYNELPPDEVHACIKNKVNIYLVINAGKGLVDVDVDYKMQYFCDAYFIYRDETGAVYEANCIGDFVLDTDEAHEYDLAHKQILIANSEHFYFKRVPLKTSINHDPTLSKFRLNVKIDINPEPNIRDANVILYRHGDSDFNHSRLGQSLVDYISMLESLPVDNKTDVNDLSVKSLSL